MKTIAVHIQSEVMFFSIEPLLKELEKSNKYNATILIEKYSEDKDGRREMSAGTVALMKKYGYSPKYTEDYANKEFDLCLTPYTDGLIKAKRYLRYPYSSFTAKPSLTYLPEVLGGFDGFLCSSTVGLKMYSAYGITFPVDNLRFYNRKKIKNETKKKRLLFSPTYNDNYTDEELKELIEELKKTYTVIIKGHHRTQHLKNNDGKKKIFEEVADEYYASDTNIADLVLGVDVCLVGNSASVAEAIYAEVPCVIYAKDLSNFALNDIQPMQKRLVDAGFPYATEKNDLSAAIEFAMSKKGRELLHQFNQELFPENLRTGVFGYIKAIEFFLEDPIGEDYLNLKKLIRQKIQQALDERDRQIEEYSAAYKDCEKVIKNYENGKIYRLAEKIYELEGKFIKKKKR